MTDQQHPITPPPELVQQWRKEWIEQSNTNKNWVCDYVATHAARWGADQELKACCEWVRATHFIDLDGHEALRAARRPQPNSLAKGPTDEEVDTWVDQQGFIRGHGDHPCGFWIDDGDAGALVRAALARWGK